MKIYTHVLLSQKHFAALSGEVREILKKQTWWQQHGYEAVFFFLRLTLFALGLLIFAQNGWPEKIIGMLIASYAFYGVGITGTHETRHSSFATKERWNRLWACFFLEFWAGQSNLWWHHRHVATHHVYTNVPNKEPKQFFYPWINKYVYFFVLPYLVTIWLFVHSVIFLWGKWKQLFIFLLLQTAGWALHIYLFSLILPLPYALLATLIMRSLFSPMFVHLAVFNHIGLDNPERKIPWLPHQSRTTRNLRPHWLINGMGGNAFVECHIEHHLFPTLSNRMIKKIRPNVKKYLEKEGHMYVEEGYISCLANCLKYYNEIFDAHPIQVVDL